MTRSVLIKLAMLGTTLSVIVWMGWTVPPNPGEARSDAAFTAHDNKPEIAPPPAAAPEIQAPPSSLINRPARTVSSQPQRRLLTVQSQVQLNHATIHELNRLPGIGPALAQRIIEYRRSHGPFTAVEDLQLVKGIGPKKLDRLRGFVTVGSQTGRDNQEGRL